MRLRTLLLLTVAGLSIAGLSLWAMNAEPDTYISLTSPAVHRYQLGLLIDGPTPDLTLRLFGYSIATGATVLLAHIDAPLWGLFFVLLWVVMVMLADAIRGSRKPARTS